MSVSPGTVLLCIAAAMAARCDDASWTRSVSSPDGTASTTLRLTAQRNDTGSWTTQFGDYEMIIEHRHFDTRKDNNDHGTWTIKVKHTFTKYPDETNIREPDTEVFGQSLSTISNIIDNSKILTDNMVVNESIQDTATTPDHTFIAGIRTEAEPTLSSNDISEETEPSYEDPLYEETEEKQIETPHYNQNTRHEEEMLMTAEERRDIMGRYPRSGFIVHDIMEHENYHKGYRFYPGIGWLKLNTSDWQWPEARAACEEDGGYLAVPDTMRKIHVLRHVLKDNADVLRHAVLKNQAFVGVFYPDRSRKATTVLGELFETENDTVWFPDEPNNAPPGEDCITLHLEGKMRDVPCFYTLPFLCQID